MSNLTIDPSRLWDSLMETARIGGLDNGGIARLTLDASDKAVRDWFAEQCAALGMTLQIDQVGNMFATRPGRNPDALPIAMGSHLDTQPTGGKFDGVLGVLAGLEALRTLDAAEYVTDAPVMLVNWTNEEGSRFAPAMLGSGVYAGVYDREHADTRVDVQGESFGTALEAIGYRGDIEPGQVEMAAMFELHIEQGPILEAEGRSIGVVQGVQGLRWWEVTLTGRAAHTGSTPMTMRRNALLAAARIIDAVDAVARGHAPDAVGTVGFVEVAPNSNNVIPGQVRFTIDLRHPEDATLEAMDAEVRQIITDAAQAEGLELDMSRLARTDAVVFDAECIASVREAARRSGQTTRDIVSGAGHDAVHVATKAPTTMIFVPSKDGLSHNEAEYTSPEHCAAGAQVLLDAVLAHDALLSSRSRAA
jgi:beta-ureidopropionase / N-carbamoyl-L-amino-acid hydrolase